MTFFNAKCEICGQYHSNPRELVAYAVRARKPERIDLRGEQPWSGVRVVCTECVAFLWDVASDPKERLS